jgi:hypothetical protein
MPESEPKPKLIELVGPGAGQGWKAVLRNGKPAVVHEIPVPAAEATAAVPRLQRLYEHRHPALSPVLAWGTDTNGVWVAVEPNEGTPLGSILSRGPLTPPAAAALGAAVLSGVAALHEAGIAMGGFGATAVRVTNNGDVRLAGHPAAAVRAAPSQSDLRADVRSCGMAVCAAFGVDPAGAPAPPNISPGLVVTMRSMASGAMGPSADRAQGALREMAAALLSPDREMAAQSELATRAGGREVPAITPFLPSGTVAPEAGPTAPSPAPYIARREETPVRAPASYDAPDRPLQTYPAMPAVTFPPAPEPTPAPPPPAPVAPAPPPPPPVPTWSDAPPRPSAPLEPAARTTNPPAPPTWTPFEAPKPAEPEPPKPAEPEPPKPAPSFESVAPASPFATSPPAPPAPPAPVETPAPSPPPAQQTWTPVEAPVWKPGETVPAEPLGSGSAVVETPPKAPTPTPAPVPRAPIAAPARKPVVPRPPSRRGPSERPPWLVPAAIAVAIVILLGIFGVIVLANRGGGTVTGGLHPTPSSSSHPSGSPRATPSASPTNKAPLAVPTYGATSADPITKVQICTTASPCNIPGGSPETATACGLSSCKLEVAFYFSSVQKSVPYSYTVKLFDRCSGQTTDLPGPSATTPASGYIVAIATDHWAVSIPSGVKSGAIVAAAQKPAVAYSAPLLLGAESC